MRWLLVTGIATACVACGGGDDTHPTGSGGSGGTGGAASSSASTTSSSAASGGGGSGGSENPCAAKFQAALDNGRAMANSPGAVMAITTPECGTWLGASGTSTTTEMIKAAEDMRIGSVTKTFVATDILLLRDAGKLTLEDPLSKYAPTFPNAEGITVRQLLNHTSGIFSYTDDPDFESQVDANTTRKWAPEELVAFAANQPPYFAPGTGWHYSNTDFILLGMIAEQVDASDKIGPQIRTRLLDPLKMKDTYFDGEEAARGKLAHGFSTTGHDVSTLFDPSWAWSAGAMVSTVSDLTTWADALYAGDVLSKASRAEMIADPIPTDQDGVGYGLGVFVLDPAVAVDVAIGHGGDIPGYHTQMWYWPNEKYTVVGIVNSDAGDSNQLLLAALDALFDLDQ